MSIGILIDICTKLNICTSNSPPSQSPKTLAVIVQRQNKPRQDNLLTEIMQPETTLYSDLKFIQEVVYDKCGFNLTNLKLNLESVEYGACSFELNGQTVEHRISKITPTKTGQFVTIWKRNKNGITEPFDISDDIDFIIITSKSEDKLGQFIFPKSVLADKGIISKNEKDGKRGIRVYPSWDIPTSKQAEKTQSWQTKYFVTIKNDNTTNLDLTTKLLSNND